MSEAEKQKAAQARQRLAKQAEDAIFSLEANEKAAAQGDLDATATLGVALLLGRGVPRDEKNRVKDAR